MATKATKTTKAATEVAAVDPKKETAAKVETKTEKAEAKKAPAKKTATKKAEIKSNVMLQFAGKEVSAKDILANVKKAWTSQLKGKLKDIKTIDIYVKTEENRAYFVINGESGENYFIEL